MWNSSHGANIFKIQNIMFRIIIGSTIRDICRHLFTSASAFTVYTSLFVFVANSNNNFKLCSDACNINTEQKLKFLQVVMFTAILNRNGSFCHPPDTIRLHYTVQLGDKFYPRILYEIYFIKGFIDERIGAYLNHRLLVTTCTSLPQPAHRNTDHLVHRKARCSAKTGDISHSSYSWPLALRDVLYMNKLPRTNCRNASVLRHQRRCSRFSRLSVSGFPVNRQSFRRHHLPPATGILPALS